MITTLLQAHIWVNEFLNKENTGTLSDTEFEVIFNKAMLDWVGIKYRELEKDQKRIDDLRVLIAPPLVLSNVGAAANGQELFNLPYVSAPAVGASHGYMHQLNVGLKLRRLVDGVATPIPCVAPGGWASARVLRSDERYKLERSPFGWPTDDEPYVLFVGSQLRVWSPVDTWAHEARIEYIRYPVACQFGPPLVDPELPSNALQEIVDLIVRKHLEIIESQRWQPNAAEMNSNKT